MAVGAVVARILTQYSDKGSKQAQKDIYKLGKRIDAFGKKAAKSFAIATAASAAFAVKIGTDAVKAAIEDSKSQAILANNLRNVAGATEASIKSVEEYIAKQQMLANVSDTELRASFSQLALATGDVTTAMDLQSIALDTAAGSGKDLGSVSQAIARATQGNFTALKKLVPTLDANIVKNKDLGAALVFLDKTFKGSAKTIGDTDPLKKLQLAYGEVLETLGYALLPVVKEFAEYVRTDVLPAIEQWVAANEGKLQDSFRTTLGYIESIVKNMVKLVEIIDKYKYFLLAVAAVPYFAGLAAQFSVIIGTAKLLRPVTNKFIIAPMVFAAKSIGKVITAIRLLGLAFTAMGARAAIAAIPVAFATAGVSIATAAAALAAVGIGAFAIKKGMDAYGDSTKKAATATTDLTKQTYGGAAANKFLAEKQAAADKAKADRDKRLLAISVQQAKEDKKKAAASALLSKVQAGLAKFGIKTTEADPIQLEAARLNLIKQGNLAEAARIAMMGKNLELQLEANKALARYNDLLAALADKTISSEEVFLLSKKWGMTIEATQSYIQTLLAVADQTISDDEITNLAKAWGVSKDKAAMYLDFFTYLNDGKLSDAEINKLQTKWGLTSKEVGIYQQLITAASDYVLSDAEITALGTNWGLTTKEVIEYIRKLGQPVTFSGTLIDPATQATFGWKNALDALNAYNAALAGKGYSGSSGSSNGYVFDPAASADSNKEAADAAQAAADAAAALAEANDAVIAAAIAAADAILGTNSSSTSGNNYSGDDGIARRAASATELSRLAALQKQNDEFAAKAAGMAAKYGGFVGSPTLDNSGSIANSSSSSGVVVNLVVNGSVTTENDLVATLRNGLLRGQYNGQSLTLEAI